MVLVPCDNVASKHLSRSGSGVIRGGGEGGDKIALSGEQILHKPGRCVASISG